MQTALFSMEARGTARKKMMLEHRRTLASEDRLSNLPEPILHDIVSRLPSRSIAWMPTLSKKLAYLLESFPGIIFDDEEFESRSSRQTDKRLDQFISKYLLHQTPILIQKVRISTSIVQHSKINHELDRFVDRILSGEIRELDLKFRHKRRFHKFHCHCYSIPSVVFTQGVYLTVLKLEGCRFGDLDAVKVPSLKTVSMRYVHISDDSFSKLVAASSSLERLDLQHCFDLTIFQIVSPSLQILVVNNFIAMECFSVDCPHLQYLECKGKEAHGHVSQLKVSDFHTSCIDLREVHFARLDLGVKLFDHMFSTSPHVQSLTMISCTVEGSLNVRPQLLKHLELMDTYFPRLLSVSTVESFSYGENSEPFLEYPNNYLMLYSALINFFQLKSLTLQGALPPSEESLESILSCCAQLRSLYLIYCWNLENLMIISSTLKTLSVTSTAVVPVMECAIVAPNLELFEFEGLDI